jgi:hypothetical protein
MQAAQLADTQPAVALDVSGTLLMLSAGDSRTCPILSLLVR